MTNERTIQIPQQMLQGLLGGPQPARKAPEVVEVMTEAGGRVCFNVDSVEKVTDRMNEVVSDCCLVKLKGDEEWIAVALSYDEFLKEINVTPRVLGHGIAAGG